MVDNPKILIARALPTALLGGESRILPALDFLAQIREKLARRLPRRFIFAAPGVNGGVCQTVLQTADAQDGLRRAEFFGSLTRRQPNRN